MARPCGVVDTAGTHVPRGPMSAALVSGNNQRCTIAVNQSLARPFQVVDFDTERNYDRLTVNGRSYSAWNGIRTKCRDKSKERGLRFMHAACLKPVD